MRGLIGKQLCCLSIDLLWARDYSMFQRTGERALQHTAPINWMWKLFITHIISIWLMVTDWGTRQTRSFVTWLWQNSCWDYNTVRGGERTVPCTWTSTITLITNLSKMSMPVALFDRSFLFLRESQRLFWCIATVNIKVLIHCKDWRLYLLYQWDHSIFHAYRTKNEMYKS